METRLAEEVVVVCRDYITKSWGVAMDWVEVPADSKLRRVENIFYPEDIRKTSSMIPPTKQPLISQAPPLDGEVSKRVGVDEEAQLSTKAKPSEDALIIKTWSHRPKTESSSFRQLQMTPHQQRLKFRVSFRSTPCVYVPFFL